MTDRLSENTQAILLLTAPLMLGKGDATADLLKPAEYQKFARHLLGMGKQPADLLSPDAGEVIEASRELVDEGRLRRLLERGFVLSQAVERWQSRAIWVISRADASYPRRLKVKMRERAPAVLYGCGDSALLNTGGLAVVGSRHVSEALETYAGEVAALAARAGQAVVSGGARGVDRAAMDGALSAGGCAVGVLAEELEREAMNRRNRDSLRAGKLVCVTEYDPRSRFSVGHAMQRNKLIYALADNALVVNSDLEKGGTWAGAVEQLEKLRFAPVFVRSTGEPNGALDALRDRGAIPWPNPSTPECLHQKLRAPIAGGREEGTENGASEEARGSDDMKVPAPGPHVAKSPAAELFQKVQDVVLSVLEEPMSEEDVAALLQVTQGQVREWLDRMVDEGLLERSTRPTRYATVRQSAGEAARPRPSERPSISEPEAVTST
jgi:DNA processing protein